MKVKTKKTSILKEINITNSVVIFLTGTLVCIFVLIINYKIIVDNERQVIQNSMQNAIIALDDKLKDMSRVSLACYSNINVQEILKEYEKYTMLEKLEAENYLNDFYTSLITIRNDISGVYLFDLHHLIYYSDYTISSVDWSYEMEPFINKYLNSFGEKTKLIVDTDIPFIRYSYNVSSQDYYYMIYPVKDFSPNIEIGYIMLSISKEKVENIIEAFMKESMEYWLVMENNVIATNSKHGKEEEIEIINKIEKLRQSDYVKIVTIAGENRLISWKESEYSQMKLVTIGSLDEIRSNYRILLIWMVLFLMVLNGLMIFVIYVRIKNKLRPLHELSNTMEHFNEKKMYIRYPIIGNDEIGRLTFSFNCMMDEIETLIEKEYKNTEKIHQYEIEQQKISMLYLKNQINPHFLYNTLDMIRTKACLNDDIEVSEMIMQLVEFYRLNVNADSQIVSIKHEIELLQKYMNIMMYRYPRLEFECRIEEELLDIDIPNFLIQPLVENALLHGLKNMRYMGKIQVDINRDNEDINKIIITVKDNGMGMPEAKIEEINTKLARITWNTEEKSMDRIGIENIQKRLRGYYSNSGEILYKNNKEGGISVIVTLLAQIKKYDLEL